MKKRSKNTSQIVGGRSRGLRPAAIISDTDKGETENVQYFLKALNQISLALHALGYVVEGEALARVKIDLHHRVLLLPERPIGVHGVLH